MLLAAPALAPPAAACHPSLELGEDLGAGTGFRVLFDMGCDHTPPYTLCVAAWTVFAELSTPC